MSGLFRGYFRYSKSLAGLLRAIKVIPSIADDQHAFERKLQTTTCIQCIQEAVYDLEITSPFVDVAHCNCEILYLDHHTGLKEIFEKLKVRDGSARFHFQYQFRLGVVCIRIKRLLRSAHASEENRYLYLAGLGLIALDFETTAFETKAQLGEYRIARTVPVFNADQVVVGG